MGITLPGSGNLSIKLLAGSSRSIENAVEGNTSGSITISSLRSQSGLGSPVNISDWYGYSNTVPSAPTSVNTEMSFVIIAAWNDTSDNETGFRIQWSINGGAYGNTHTVGAGVSEASLPIGCVNGSTYRCRVQSFNGVGNSSYVISGNQATGDGNCPS